jgi:hypothetical protein
VISTQRDTAAAFVLPFVIYGIWVVASGWWPGIDVWELQIKSFTLPALIAGFVFLARRFGYYAIPLAIIYFPVMFPALLIFALGLRGGI